MSKKIITLLHNPSAGEGEHEKEMLINAISDAGHKCIYHSVKEEGWDEISSDTVWIAVAGGDGTVKKCIRLLSSAKYRDRDWPIGLLPLGTANNVAETLGIEGKSKTLISKWGNNTTTFDVGSVNWENKTLAFGEGVGIGVFPTHIQHMKSRSGEVYPMNDPLQVSRVDLLRAAASFKPFSCELEIDGKKVSGTYLSIEILNIKSLGANVMLAPSANPGDGLFNVLLLQEEHRKELADYLCAKIIGQEWQFKVNTICASKVSLFAMHHLLRIDDEIHETEQPLHVEIGPGEKVLRFFVK